MHPRRIVRGFEPRGMEVRGAERADLARIDQLAERGEHILLRHAVIVLMREIQVDAIDTEPLERGLGGGGDMGGCKFFAIRAREHADLGRDQDLVALARGLEPFADHRLGFAALMAGRPGRIDIGCVDHRAAAGDESIEHGKACCLVEVPAEYIAAQDERGDVKIGRAKAT